MFECEGTARVSLFGLFWTVLSGWVALHERGAEKKRHSCAVNMVCEVCVCDSAAAVAVSSFPSSAPRSYSPLL